MDKISNFFTGGQVGSKDEVDVSVGGEKKSRGAPNVDEKYIKERNEYLVLLGKNLD